MSDPVDEVPVTVVPEEEVGDAVVVGVTELVALPVVVGNWVVESVVVELLPVIGGSDDVDASAAVVVAEPVGAVVSVPVMVAVELELVKLLVAVADEVSVAPSEPVPVVPVVPAVSVVVDCEEVAVVLEESETDAVELALAGSGGSVVDDTVAESVLVGVGGSVASAVSVAVEEVLDATQC